MTEFNIKQIGTVRSPHKQIKGIPIQPAAAKGIKGTIEIFPEYSEGLKDLNGFSHIILIYYFHLISNSKLSVVPFLDDQQRGVFATRAPSRPNPIGLSVVELKSIEGNLLKIRDVDVFDGTPLLDIKPFIEQFDNRENTKIGWLEKNIRNLSNSKDDGRFRTEQ